MKRRITILGAGILISCLVFVSCNSSVKGNWSDADKQKFRDDMNGVKELSNFGDNKDKWIDCYLSKCEANYSSYAMANLDESGCKEIAFECNEEVLTTGSVQGNWSDADKKSFRDEMNKIDELSSLGDSKTEWIECYLSKCEANYSSFYKANMDVEGCERMAMKCNEEVFSMPQTSTEDL